MPGPFYFVWVAPEATTFDVETHAVEDESVYAFDLSQEEGDFAKLSLTIRNPRVGLLNPGRNVWAWLSYSPSSGVIEPLFFGRLVGIPTWFFEDICPLDF